LGYYRDVLLADGSIISGIATGSPFGMTGGVRIIWGAGRSYPSAAANV
jgi:hypothetical protein